MNTQFLYVIDCHHAVFICHNRVNMQCLYVTDVSTCNATAAEVTTEATVTCLFPVDIRRSLLGFRVEHYKRDLNEIGEYILPITIRKCLG